MSSQEPADPPRRAESDAPSGPVPCLGGCGFYGGPETAGYCSVCYQKHSPGSSSTTDDSTASPMTAAGDAATIASDDTASAMSIDGGSSTSTESSAVSAKPSRPVQTKPHRCWECSKKMKPAGRFNCKCGYIFCAKHRYADAHNCDFDHKKDHSDRLAKSNPEVAPDKMVRI